MLESNKYAYIIENLPYPGLSPTHIQQNDSDQEGRVSAKWMTGPSPACSQSLWAMHVQQLFSSMAQTSLVTEGEDLLMKHMEGVPLEI